MDQKTSPGQANRALRAVARELRENAVVLRVQAATAILRNRRLLLSIRELLRKKRKPPLA